MVWQRCENDRIQSKILAINPLDVYVLCGCRRYNLVLNVTLFWVFQRTLTVFLACIPRWKVLLYHSGLYPTKKHSFFWNTLLEIRINSIKAGRYQISAIHDALITLFIKNPKTDAQISMTLLKSSGAVKDFSLIV